MERKGAQKSNSPRFQDNIGYCKVSYNMTMTSVSQFRSTPSVFPILQFCYNLIYRDREARCTLIP